MSVPTIVCVDDERSILSGLQQQLLTEFGDKYIFEFAASGDEALEIIEDQINVGRNIPLVITDQMMPGMKGDELIEKIKLVSPDTNCVLLTGYAHSDIIKELQEKQILKCLSKPWDRQDIIDVVNMAVMNDN
jgi:two-component system sensor histidine kinase/response regulator